MDTLAALANGFAVALTPFNLLWAMVGVTLGTAVGVLPGIGPALTVALLLPVTFNLDPTAAFIMFAGIYYGAMYGGSTTSILLNTPGESATIVTALEGNLMARKGRGGPALATAAIGSFVAGTIATLALTFIAPRHGAVRAALQPGGLFRAHGAGLHHRHRRARQLALARPRQPVLRPGARPGRDRHPVRPGALHARHPGAARRHRRDRGRGRPVRGRRDPLRRQPLPLRARGDHPGQRLDLDERGGLGALVEAVAARHRARLPVRHAAGRRRRDSDLPVLHGGEAPRQAARGVRPWRHRGRGRPRGGQQRGRRRRAGAAAGARPADLGDRRHPARRVPAVRAAARAAAVRHPAGAGLGPDREPLHRQRDAAALEPAAGRPVGEGAQHPARRSSMPASWCSRRSAPTRSTTTWST